MVDCYFLFEPFLISLGAELPFLMHHWAPSCGYYACCGPHPLVALGRWLGALGRWVPSGVGERGENLFGLKPRVCACVSA